MVPRGQVSVPSNAAPGSIIGFQPVEIFAVRYVNEEGREEDELFQRFAGQWYKAPNGINYANSLRRFKDSSKLAKNLNEQYAAKIAPKKVPAQDGADIIPE